VPEPVLDRAAGCLFGLAIGGDLRPAPALAVIVARCLLGRADYDRATVEAAVQLWKAAGGGQASPLVRAVAVGLWARDPETAAATARLDCPDAQDNPGLAAAIAAGVNGASPAEIKRLAGREIVDGSSWDSAISCALAGAAFGRSVFPVPQVMRVLTWRPDEGLGVARPRPEICWTDDLVDLAEALLCQGSRSSNINAQP